MVATPQATIEMSLTVKMHCDHIDGENFRRCQGEFRQDIISQSKDTLGNFVRHAPADLLKANNPNVNKDIEKTIGGITRIHQANNITRQMKTNMESVYGLTSSSDLANQFMAWKNIERIELEDRRVKCQLAGKDDKPYEKCLGVVQRYSVNFADGGFNESTNVELVLSTLNKARIFEAASIANNNSRLSCHLDGTGLDIHTGAVVGKGRCVQTWQLWMTNHHLIPSGSTHVDVIRRNASPLLLMEAHMGRTNAEDLSSVLNVFLGIMRDHCETVQIPLVLHTDCAAQLQNAILMAYTSPGKILLTRISYNNVVTLFMLHCERINWDRHSCIPLLEVRVVKQLKLCCFYCCLSLT
jgi:hypothetical protein